MQSNLHSQGCVVVYYSVRDAVGDSVVDGVVVGTAAVYDARSDSVVADDSPVDTGVTAGVLVDAADGPDAAAVVDVAVLGDSVVDVGVVGNFVLDDVGVDESVVAVVYVLVVDNTADCVDFHVYGADGHLSNS